MVMVSLFMLFLPLLASAQPANDMFANRIVITGTNTVVTANNIGATRETSEPSPAGVSSGASVWWSWTPTNDGTATISTSGSSFDTVLGIYTGSSVSALNEIASNDDDSDYTSKIVFDVTANQTYAIDVSGYGGATGTIHLSVQLGPIVPPPPAPAWNLPDVNGVMIHSTNYAGKVVIFDFWATWCSPCKAEMPDLVALQEKYRGDGLVIIGPDVSWSGENAQTVKDFLATWTPTVNYQVVMSTSAAEAPYGSIAAIPTTFIIDRQNRIRKSYVGTQTRTTLERQIIPLLYGNTRMACSVTGNQVTLRWPTNAVTFTLESTTNIANPSWIAWPNATTVINGSNTLQTTLSTKPTYFRLRLPY